MIPATNRPYAAAASQATGPPSSGAWVIPSSKFKPAAGPHERGAEDGVLHPAVISQDAPRRARRPRSGWTDEPLGQRQHAGRRQQAHAPEPGRERPIETRPEGSGRPGRSSAVDLDVEHVVEGRARRVEDHRGDRPAAASDPARPASRLTSSQPARLSAAAVKTLGSRTSCR